MLLIKANAECLILKGCEAFQLYSVYSTRLLSLVNVNPHRVDRLHVSLVLVELKAGVEEG